MGPSAISARANYALAEPSLPGEFDAHYPDAGSPGSSVSLGSGRGASTASEVTVPTRDPSRAQKSQVLLVCHERAYWGEDGPIRRALAQHLSVDEYIVDEHWPDSAVAFDELSRYQAVIWFTRFRQLRHRPPFDWAGYDGLRLMYDWDAFFDFSTMASKDYLGQWAEVFRRHQFDVLVCTGQRTRDNLRTQGVDAEWIPKAAGEEFRDLGLVREGLCTFGAEYPSRQVVLSHLRRSGLAVSRLSAPPKELNVGLNRHVGCIITNAELRLPAKLAKALVRISAGRVPVLAEGPEPMAKNFEVAASGTAAICDEMAELADLGFVDGSTAVLYRSLTELTDKLVPLLAEPDTLRVIGQNSAALVRDRHTWDERGAEFASLIASRLKG